MDLVSLFAKERETAGLEISDDFLRLALLARNYEAKGNVYIKELVEEPLEAGVIVSGIIKNSEKFISSLTKLLSGSKTRIDYCIVSISHLNLYSKVFSFPKNVGTDKLTEAMKVTVNFNLPVKPETVYIDWEEIHSEDKNELMLATVPKEIVEGYVAALKALQITPIAFESNVLSAIRMLDLNTEKPTLLITRERNQTGFIILKNGAIRFSRFAPRGMEKGELDLEAKKISNFYESEKESIAKIVDISEIAPPKKFANHPKIGGEAKSADRWLIVLGTALRGLLPASEDKLISLMAVGTEDSYAKQERIVFVKLLGDITTLVAVFITVAFLMVWLLMVSIRSSVDAQVGLTSGQVTGEDQAIETRAVKLNSIMETLINIDKLNPRFSLVLEEIRAKVIPEITIMGVSIPGPEQIITLSGIADLRKDISNFKTSIAGSELFTDVQSPPSNLDKRENIPFTMSFRLKDSSILYK